MDTRGQAWRIVKVIGASFSEADAPALAAPVAHWPHLVTVAPFSTYVIFRTPSRDFRFQYSAPGFETRAQALLGRFTVPGFLTAFAAALSGGRWLCGNLSLEEPPVSTAVATFEPVLEELMAQNIEESGWLSLKANAKMAAKMQVATPFLKCVLGMHAEVTESLAYKRRRNQVAMEAEQAPKFSDVLKEKVLAAKGITWDEDKLQLQEVKLRD